MERPAADATGELQLLEIGVGTDARIPRAPKT